MIPDCVERLNIPAASSYKQTNLPTRVVSRLFEVCLLINDIKELGYTT